MRLKLTDENVANIILRSSEGSFQSNTKSNESLRRSLSTISNRMQPTLASFIIIIISSLAKTFTLHPLTLSFDFAQYLQKLKFSIIELFLSECFIVKEDLNGVTHFSCFHYSIESLVGEYFNSKVFIWSGNHFETSIFNSLKTTWTTRLYKKKTGN